MKESITQLALHIDNLDGSPGSFIYGGKATPRGGLNTIGPHETTSLQIIIQNSVTIIIIIAIVLSLFFLIWGGIRWITSGGDKAKVESARGTIIAAIIGLVIAFLAFFILSLALSFFGLSLTNLTLPKIPTV